MRLGILPLLVFAVAACTTADTGTPTTPVVDLGVRGILVSPSVTTIRTTESQQFTTTVDVKAGVSSAVTWSSDNAAVASVSATGVVTGMSAGTATVRATSTVDPKVAGAAVVTVSNFRGITITPSTVSLPSATTRALTATVTVESGASTAVTWRSGNAAIATVSTTGVVTAVAPGTVTITALAAVDTMLRSTAIVTVTPAIRSVTLSPTTASTYINATQQLTATVSADAGLATTLTWRSSTPTVATVSASGLVTGVAVGSTTITALSTVDTTKRATATITVVPRTTTVTIAQRLVGMNPGTTRALSGSVFADPGIGTGITWTSSAPTVASISSSGLVTAIRAGTTLITATSQADATKRDTVTVSVVPLLPSSWSGTHLNGVLYDDVAAITAIDASTAYAVSAVNGASGGDIYRWNGTAWSRVLAGATLGTQFLAIHGSAAGNILAVGTNGVIARFDGSAWAAMPSGTTRTLKSVWAESATSAYAVGTNGTVLRLASGTWSALATNLTTSINGVWSGNGMLYVVGDAGVVLRWTNGAWVRQTVPFRDDFNAVAGQANGTIVAVGDVGGIVAYDGSGWSLVGSNGISGDLYAVAATAGNRFYLGGYNGLFQLDGSSVSTPSAAYPVSIFGVSTDASGAPWSAGQRGAVQRLAGSTWTTVNIAPDLLDAWATSATNAWAVGEFGFVYRWNGATWARQLTPTQATLYSVWAPSASDAFAGGDNGTVLRWNGTAWNTMTVPATGRIYGLSGTGSSNVLAVTDLGELLRFNGTAWSLVATAPGNTPLLAVMALSPTVALATGMNGLVMRFDGTTWTAVTGPDASSTLYGLWSTDASNIWTVGARSDGVTGMGAQYTGTAWQALSVPSTTSWTSLGGASATDLHATGDAGSLLRWNGSSWSTVSTGVTDQLWAMTTSPDATGSTFAVGINGALVTAGVAPPALDGAGVSLLAPGSLDLSPAAQRARRALAPAVRRRIR